MAFQKKYIIAGSIGLVTISGAFLYLQYKKLTEGGVKFKSIKLHTANNKNVDVDLTVLLTNKSALSFDIISQEYKVYLNNILLADITNPTLQKINAKSENPITVNIKFNPASIGGKVKLNAVDILSNVLSNNIRIDLKLKIGLWFMKFSVPFTYTTTLQQLLAAK